MGLPILECEDTEMFKNGDRLSVDFDKGDIRHLDSDQSYSTKPIPRFMQALLQSGGLMKYIAKRINQ
jgi:3-isopropylmalate/(R)-2-methylmalate dehydratase small subunit